MTPLTIKSTYQVQRIHKHYEIHHLHEDYSEAKYRPSTIQIDDKVLNDIVVYEERMMVQIWHND